MNKLCLFLLALSLLFSTILAEKQKARTKIKLDKDSKAEQVLDEDFLAKERGFYMRNKDITVVGRLSNSAFGMVGYGERSRVAVEFANSGASNYTIASMTGVFVDVSNSSRILRNLSTYSLRLLVKPKSNVTLRYDFSANLEPPAEAVLYVLVDYMKGNGSRLLEDELPYRAVAYENAIQVVYMDSAFDLQSLFLYFLGVVVLLGTVYLFRNVWLNSGSKPNSRAKASASRKSSKSAPNEADTAKAGLEPGVVNDDWIPEHIKKLQAKQGGSLKRRNKN